VRLSPRRLLASGFGAGHCPASPGTAGTLAAVPLAWVLAHLPALLHTLVLLAALPFAARVCDRAAREDGRADPGWIVLDEIVGYCIAVALLPATPVVLALGFALFRLFDIVKPPPVGWLDRRVSGGWGILLDDVAAGLMTRVVLAIVPWIPPIGGGT
jgi:phosphatidylglycerophosphatase A